MKKMISPKKTTILGIAIVLIMALTACNKESNPTNSTFPNIDDADIPDVLEITVGTLGDVYFSAGITDNPEYKSVLKVTFHDVTEDDYTTLMEHYQSASTGKSEEGSLLFDWGRLQVTTEDDSILLNAYIK